ncbi:MAG: nucleotidyl transferase AbiEii/AbiGii toxin family protein [Planctomycetes bacterium]|nr:nucleotidyl transferase AbiEii/AbiGii toxin family protein [Planctomycetota bacterium]
MPASILTPLQKLVLERLFDSGLGDRGYFLSGGTALAEFYLQHRLSDDLDIFTRKPNLSAEDLELVRHVFEELGLETNRERRVPSFAEYFVWQPGSPDKLKLQFVGGEVPATMAPPFMRGTIVVDSLEDIAVNKVCTIVDRFEAKDFVDLHFILRETRFQLDYLLARASEKDMDVEGEEGQLTFATSLLRVRDLAQLPRMIKPLTLEQLRVDLTPRAEELIRRLRPRG